MVSGGRSTALLWSRRAKDTVRQIYHEAASLHDKTERTEAAKWATISESCSRLEAMVKLAASEEGIEVLPLVLDRDPWLLYSSTAP